jgi:hypothetical protein
MSEDKDRLVESSSEESNEWVRVVATLIKLTEEGKLVWKSSSPSESIKREPNSRIEAVYSSNYKNKKLRLFAESTKVEDSGLMPNIGIFKKQYPYYRREVVLQMGDKSEYGWYTISDVDDYTLENLLESVKYRVLGVEDFLDEILDNDKKSEE